MRSMLLVVLALFAASAVAEDAPKPQPPKLVAWEDWSAELDAVVKRKLSTIARVEKLRALCDSRLIEVRGKIRDIKKSGDGMEIATCGVHGVPPDLGSFFIAADEKPAVANWGMWDRLTWRLTPSVSDDGEVLYDRVYAGPGDVKRTENPGTEWPKIENAGSATQFAEWCIEFSGHVAERRDAAAIASYRKAAKVRWVLPGAVKEDEIREGWVCVVLESRSARHWSAVPDPQIASLLRPGSKVDVVFEYADTEEAAQQAVDGTFVGRSWVWRFNGGLKKK